jgi:hypothetical protein
LEDALVSKFEETEALRLLEVKNGRPVYRDPLVRFGFCYYPSRGYWRRARSHRDEVTRSAVAKRIGVPEDVLAAWEEAARAAAADE